VCIPKQALSWLHTNDGTDNDQDAFWLAQVHFSTANYTRSLSILYTRELVSRSPSCKYLAGHCYIKQNKFEQALSVLGEHNPTHLVSSSGNSRRKLQHINGNSGRHVTLRNNGKGTLHRTDRIERSEEREREDTSDIKFEAAMCYLRGLCYAKQNAFDRARDCYKDAVRIDVQCFEAFDQLMKNSLLSPSEELAFLESLDFDSISAPSDPSTSQEAAHFTKLLYTTRISKYASPLSLSHATETLSTHYNLSSNPDLLLSRAETLYTQCRFPEALAVTTSILSSPSPSSTNPPISPSATANPSTLGHNPSVYPLHLACLYETTSTNQLFLLSHTLADTHPEEPYTWLAVGIYYLLTSRIAEARRFFSKASLMDPHSAPAWIGFAHTFAAEGEHDQAIAAYSTAARLFQGSHLPQLFLGMQHLALNQMSLAHEYLTAAYNMSSGTVTPGTLPIHPTSEAEMDLTSGDPLVLNELAVVFYHQSHIEPAAQLFRHSLALAAALGCNPAAYLATRANLGHAYRRLRQFDDALEQFDECLRVGASGGTNVGFAAASASSAMGPSHGSGTAEDRSFIGSVYTAKGLCLMEMGRYNHAVIALHEAIRVLGGDGGAAGGLLTRAVEIWGSEERVGRADGGVGLRDTGLGLESAGLGRSGVAGDEELLGDEANAWIDPQVDDILGRARRDIQLGQGVTRNRGKRMGRRRVEDLGDNDDGESGLAGEDAEESMMVLESDDD
jgi:anaphase-promoting complex subunit 6